MICVSPFVVPFVFAFGFGFVSLFPALLDCDRMGIDWGSLVVCRGVIADIDPDESGDGDIVIAGVSVIGIGFWRVSSEIGIDDDRIGLSFRVGRGC